VVSEDVMQNQVMVLRFQLGELPNDIMPDEGRARDMVNKPSVVIRLPILGLRVAISTFIILNQFVVKHFSSVMEKSRQI
jgi:hypothetical protein